MNYEQALAYIHKIDRFGMVLGLDTIRELLKRLGNPQDDLKIIHIAGTNGKGSTSSFIASSLIESGYKIGLYTSPFLERFNERIKVDGIDIGDQDLADTVEIVRDKIETMVSDGLNHPTEFEVVTAVAFYYFKKVNVDLVVLEVGLGGRYDATNVIGKSLVSVIASISKDHTKVLGDDIEKIAWEKAGIIKEGGHVILYGQDKLVEDVIKKVASENNADILVTDNESIVISKYNLNNQVFTCRVGARTYEDIKIRMVGEYQSRNALLAINVLVYLKDKLGFDKINDETIYEGLLKTKWPARFEVVSDRPLYILDGGHNLDGAKALVKEMDRQFDESWEKTLVLGILADKDVDSMVKILAPKFDHIILTLPDNSRAMDLEELAYRVGMYCDDIICIESSEDAVKYSLDLQKKIKEERNSTSKVKNKKTSSKKAKKVGKSKEPTLAKKNNLVIGAGSLFMVGSMRTVLRRVQF